jgi:hypothetical protein
MKKFLMYVFGALLLAGLSAAPRPAQAAVGWVGNIFPALGSSNAIPTGSTFDVYIEVWKSGVTDAPGQGAGIQCKLWSSTGTINMTYLTDIGNNDQYKGTWTAGSTGAFEIKPYCTDGVDLWPTGSNISVTVTGVGMQALWLDKLVLAWNGSTSGVTSYKLLYDPDGAMNEASTATTPYSGPASAGFLPLTLNGTISGFPKNPNATGTPRLELANTVTDAQLKDLLKGEVRIAALNSSGSIVQSSFPQIQGVLDALYASTAKTQVLGLSYSAGIPTLKVWAPTAKSVAVRRFADPTTAVYTATALTFDATAGCGALQVHLAGISNTIYWMYRSMYQNWMRWLITASPTPTR